MRRILGLVCAALLVASGAAAKPPLWDKLIRGKGRFQVLKACGMVRARPRRLRGTVTQAFGRMALAFPWFR
jgi:hypothetical protein